MDYKIVSIAKRILVKILYSNGVRFTETESSINIRCPHCGDSRSVRSKKRGFFMFGDFPGKGWMFYYKCQNGGCEFNKAIGIQRYLHRFHNNAYEELKAELSGNAQQVATNYSDFDWTKMEQEQREKVVAESKERLRKEQIETQYFVPLNSPHSDSSIVNHYIDKAIKYCIRRNIPELVYMKFFVAIDGKYRDRIVVPFYRKDEKPTYFQCRAIDGQEPKYLNRYGIKQLYNIDFINWDSPVIVTEGAFDSMFFDNAFAMSGISSNSAEFVALLKDHRHTMYFLLDNDSAGATQSAELMKLGCYVFLWRRFISDFPKLHDYMNELKSNNLKVKLDWNDVVSILGKNMWCTTDIAKYFSRNPLDIPYIRGYRNG